MSKISMDMVKVFSGDGDVVSWLKKVSLVAKLKDVTDLASFIPLYLEGDALALYLELPEEAQKDAEKIQSMLIEAFTDDAFTAHRKLCGKKWCGESVDVFANEIRKLAGLSNFDENGVENITRLVFVNGFPEEIRVALQRIPNVKKMSIGDLITQARILTANISNSVVAAGKVDNAVSLTSVAVPRKFTGRCFICGGPHMARNCIRRKSIVCFNCGGNGHKAVDCVSGNGGGVTSAPVVTPKSQ